jgi:hypothetical protein
MRGPNRATTTLRSAYGAHRIGGMASGVVLGVGVRRVRHGVRAYPGGRFSREPKIDDRNESKAEIVWRLQSNPLASGANGGPKLQLLTWGEYRRSKLARRGVAISLCDPVLGSAECPWRGPARKQSICEDVLKRGGLQSFKQERRS